MRDNRIDDDTWNILNQVIERNATFEQFSSHLGAKDPDSATLLAILVYLLRHTDPNDPEKAGRGTRKAVQYVDKALDVKVAREQTASQNRLTIAIGVATIVITIAGVVSTLVA